MRIVKCRVMQPVRLWLSDSGRKLAVAEAWRGVDVYDLHTGDAPAGLGGGLAGRLIDGFDDQDRLQVIPGKAFPLNLGQMSCTEANEVPTPYRVVYSNERFRTAASPVVLSADGSRCVAAIGSTLRLFAKKPGGAWAEKWLRHSAERMVGPIRFLRDDARFTLVESDYPRKGRPFIRHNLLIWDVRTGRELRRSEPSRRPFSHLVSVGRKLVVAKNAVATAPPSGEVVVYDADHPDREPHAVASGKDPIAALCADPLGRFVLTATAKLVTQWDPANWQPVRTFNWKIGTITCLTVNPTGTLAAAGGHQGKVAMWDVE